MHVIGIYTKGTASPWEWQDCHGWEIGEMNIYIFLQEGKPVVGSLCKYLLTQELKFYFFI